MRDNIILKCTECGEENYINTKNKRNHPEFQFLAAKDELRSPTRTFAALLAKKTST